MKLPLPASHQNVILSPLLWFLLAGTAVQAFSPESRIVANDAPLITSTASDEGYASASAGIVRHPARNHRREILQTCLGISVLAVPTLPSLAAAAAATTTENSRVTATAKPSIVPPIEVLQRLRRVPTFTLVDGTGVPFTTYDTGTATANGYFFLEYENAQAVLEDAKAAFEKAQGNNNNNNKDDDAAVYDNNWGNSRIVTVPLDFAMRLTVSQTSNVAQNGKSFRTNYQVLPSAVRLGFFFSKAFLVPA